MEAEVLKKERSQSIKLSITYLSEYRRTVFLNFLRKKLVFL